MRTSLVVAIGFLALSLAGGGVSLAQSKCDQGISKAAGKKVYCKLKVIAKGQVKGEAADPIKLTKCEEKFDKACVKAQSKGDCAEQTQPCLAIELEADACVAILDGSPSGAFLD